MKGDLGSLQSQGAVVDLVLQLAGFVSQTVVPDDRGDQAQPVEEHCGVYVC